ncbi:sugar-binding transcriptional regulator [Arcanobacterium canis]|uniref:Sugar-binding transcriptional regulator n=1 Tax=Arcanobacterium canis TaxID=999183 RepID=A0ABY8FY84_9ACTO|nr:sugar-binding transcriptional regulator [Arcanobacterium canis]WFM83481.1 sugar-binding transcriptional regulator [Arcanobacterium canis]
MARHYKREDIQLLLQVARMYYDLELTQVEIAQKIGYSRPSVSRLLDRARKIGVVRVQISHPFELLFNLESELKKFLPLKVIRVTDPSSGDSLDAIGRAAAELLVSVVDDGEVIAMGNGRSLAAVARHVPFVPKPRCTVVQLLGSLPGGRPEFGRDSSTICNMVAGQLGATSVRMPVPLFVDNPALLQPLLREERVASTLALASRAHVAVVGVADVETEPSDSNVLSQQLSRESLQVLRNRGGVGHVLDQIYNEKGEVIHTSLTERTIALPLAQLREVPLVIGVASSKRKAQAIISGIRGGILTGLVTDTDTAREILRLIS